MKTLVLTLLLFSYRRRKRTDISIGYCRWTCSLMWYLSVKINVYCFHIDVIESSNKARFYLLAAPGVVLVTG